MAGRSAEIRAVAEQIDVLLDELTRAIAELNAVLASQAARDQPEEETGR